jgi:hypothetical protein
MNKIMNTNSTTDTISSTVQFGLVRVADGECRKPEWPNVAISFELPFNFGVLFNNFCFNDPIIVIG